MEMERIDENTIRVILGNDDLAERGVTVLDLLGDHQQVEKFFYSILEEVDTDHMFAGDEAVSFQVMPNKKGLEILISKMSDEDLAEKEQLQSAFKPKAKVKKNNSQLAALQRKLQGTDQDDDDDFSHYLEDRDVNYRQLVLQLPDFEALIQLASVLRVDSAISNLYRYQGVFYLELVLFEDEMHDISADDALTIAKEYGQKTTVTAEVLAEYGEKIMDQVALQLTRHYFLNDHQKD